LLSLEGCGLLGGVLLDARALLRGLTRDQPDIRASAALTCHERSLILNVLARGLIEHGLRGIGSGPIGHALELAIDLVLIANSILRLKRLQERLLGSERVLGAPVCSGQLTGARWVGNICALKRDSLWPGKSGTRSPAAQPQ